MEQLILWVCLLFAAVVLVFVAREDWFHLSRPARRVPARVVGHREQMDERSRSFAAILEFPDETGGHMRIEDKLYSALPTPTEGCLVEVTHPRDMPHRARINRPWRQLAIYLFLLYLIAVLVGRLTGRLSAGDGI
jgi:Protein of unknown function (DUF3592)